MKYSYNFNPSLIWKKLCRYILYVLICLYVLLIFYMSKSVRGPVPNLGKQKKLGDHRLKFFETNITFTYCNVDFLHQELGFWRAWKLRKQSHRRHLAIALDLMAGSVPISRRQIGHIERNFPGSFAQHTYPSPSPLSNLCNRDEWVWYFPMLIKIHESFRVASEFKPTSGHGWNCVQRWIKAVIY